MGDHGRPWTIYEMLVDFNRKTDIQNERIENSLNASMVYFGKKLLICA